jgi:hypothetical protein
MPDRSELWARWKRLSHRAARIQSHILLFILYAAAVVPFGAMRKLWTDPLATRRDTPSWRPRSKESDDVAIARRQF